ncbi:MAG: glycyl-radical enzyme activating protein [Chitinispirillaceae bacterium]|nr:glycyl-radical enzyme activating protein [Chitinispirillaceae bacterium]
MSSTGIILDIDRFATHDGPGIRTTIFLNGCPLSCLWCHSPESQSTRPQLLFRPEKCVACGLCQKACPRGALSMNERSAVLDRSVCDSCGICCETCYSGALELAGREVSVEEIVERVARDAPYFAASGGGVTLSGGEPLAQPDFTRELLAAFKGRGIHTAVETTGYCTWDSLLHVSQVTDLFLYDLKAAGDDIHRRYTGVSNRRIIENLKRLCATNSRVQVRVPCIPGVNDSAGQIADLAETAAAAGVRSLALLPYNGAAAAKYAWIGREYTLGGLRRQDGGQMEALAAVCRGKGLDVEIVG